MFGSFILKDCISAFLVLFAVIDIIGSVPVIINLRNQGRPVSPMKTSVLSFVLLSIFYFAGDMVLRFFSVDIHSFALAGSIVLFIIALEMLLDVEIFKTKDGEKPTTLVPLVFPMIAGAGSFTTLLSLKADFSTTNIVIALVLNVIFVFFVVSQVDRIEKLFGKGGIVVLRKFFGVLLIAIAARMFTTNLVELIQLINHSNA